MKRNTIKTLLLIVAVAITIIFQVWSTKACIRNSSIDSWLVRAKDAGNPGQVSEFLKNYKETLYESDMVKGKYSSVFKYPGTYMPVYIRTVDGLVERANALSKQNPTDTSYQMGLVNLEKDLGDIELIAGSIWIASGGWMVIIATIIGWILIIVALIIIVFSYLE